jgi:hypothetical protein
MSRPVAAAVIVEIGTGHNMDSPTAAEAAPRLQWTLSKRSAASVTGQPTSRGLDAVVEVASYSTAGLLVLPSRLDNTV